MNAAAITIMHALPGRIRVKVARLRENPALMTQIRESLASVPGVHKVEINKRTDSVLILYNADALGSPAGFRAFMEPLAALFPDLTLPDVDSWQSFATRGAGSTAALPPLGKALRSFFGELNARMDQTTAGNLDLKMLTPLLLFGLGIRSLITSEKLISPAWYDFLWFALGTYFMLNPKPDEGQR